MGKRQHEIILLIHGLIVGALLWCNCSRDPLSGTISEENTGTVQGLVRYENLQPAQDITVSINHVDDSDGNTAITVSTDLNGHFSVKHLKWGTYTAEAIQLFTGSMKPFSLAPTDTVTYIELTLRSLGSIHGMIDTSILSQSDPAAVYLPEVDRRATVSSNGEFVFENIAAATYNFIALTESDTLSAGIEVPVAAGKRTFLALPENAVIHDDSSALQKHQSLQCVKLNTTTTMLSWNVVKNVSDVRIVRRSADEEPDTIMQSDTDTAFTDSSLMRGKTYHYFIRMRNRFTDHIIRSPVYAITTPSSEEDNRAPVIALSSPARDTAIVKGTPFTISADVSDSDGTIRAVAFMVDSGVISTVTSTPYQVALPDLAVKRYTITALAVDNGNDTTWSSSVSLFVDTLLRGDVNGDGVLSMIDPEYISRYYVDLPVSLFNADAAEVDGDGVLSLTDALVIAQLLNGTLSIIPWYSSEKAAGF